MRIKLRHLEVFNALIDAGSVSQAAERLHLSQPAVSIALSNLEDDLGYRLFHRDRGFFAPTKEALMLNDEVRQGLAALARIEQRSDDIRTGKTGGISIATNGAMSINFLPQVVARFQHQFPGTFVDLRVRSSRQVASWVASRQVDIGLIDAPVPVAGLSSRMFRMQCVCIMKTDDPLASEQIITPEHLKNRTIIGVTGDHTVDRQLNEAMTEADIQLNQSASAYFYAIARSLVAAGDSVAIVDPMNGKAPLGDGVTWRPFAPAIYHELVLITPRDAPLGLASARIHELIEDGLATVSDQ